jgi:hypothetical protein
MRELNLGRLTQLQQAGRVVRLDILLWTWRRMIVTVLIMLPHYPRIDPLSSYVKAVTFTSPVQGRADRSFARNQYGFRRTAGTEREVER